MGAHSSDGGQLCDAVLCVTLLLCLYAKGYAASKEAMGLASESADVRDIIGVSGVPSVQTPSARS